MIVDIVSAGAKLRLFAKNMSHEAKHSIAETDRQCKSAEHASRTLLAELDTLRRQVGSKLVWAYPLYRLAGLHSPGLVARAEASLLPLSVSVEAPLPVAPSAVLWLACGALTGAVIGAACVFAAGHAVPLGWALGIATGLLVGLSLSGVLQGRNAVAAARVLQQIARHRKEHATVHVAQLDRITKGATLSIHAITTRESQVDLRRNELESIAFDTTNAAKLLKDVLNTALLGEDGALLEDVIQRLHQQKQQITGFAAQIDAQVQG